MIYGYRCVSAGEGNLTEQDIDGADIIFDDTITRVTGDRPELMKLFSLIERGDRILIGSFDVLAQDVVELAATLDGILKMGVSVEFKNEHLAFEPDAEDHVAQLHLHLMGTLAHFDRAMIR